eukprot:scaffold37744_cov151-Skeletonema_marinoi.AAC.7
MPSGSSHGGSCTYWAGSLVCGIRRVIHPSKTGCVVQYIMECKGSSHGSSSVWSVPHHSGKGSSHGSSSVWSVPHHSGKGSSHGSSSQYVVTIRLLQQNEAKKAVRLLPHFVSGNSEYLLELLNSRSFYS